MAEVILFAGPSTCGVPQQLFRGITQRGPAARGDIDALLGRGRRRAAAGVIVLCDGIFQSRPAVSHAELCNALDAGWRVWGVSSLGAIRAWEMRDEGMHGFGWVHAQFVRHGARGGDFCDDELCLLHLPMAPYTPWTEALVNLRYAFEQRGAALGIGPAAQRRVIELLRGCWFGERGHELMLDLLVGPGGVAPASALALLAWLEHHRIKSLDLQALLTTRPWRAR